MDSKIYSLGEPVNLSDMDFKPEHSETAYRRGHRDGILQGYNYIMDIIATHGVDEERLEAFWYWALSLGLWEWVRNSLDKDAPERVTPPRYYEK